MKNEEDKYLVKKNIVEGASRLFLKYGCKKVTMDQISQELHISKRTIYEIFDDKRDLLKACISAMSELFVKKPTQNDDNETVLLMMLASAHNHSKAMEKHALMVNDLRTYYPEIYEMFHHKSHQILVEGLTDTLAKQKAKGRIREDIDPNEAALTILGLARLNRERDFFGDKGIEERTKILSDVIYTYMRGIMTVDTIISYENRKEEMFERFRKHEADSKPHSLLMTD